MDTRLPLRLINGRWVEVQPEPKLNPAPLFQLLAEARKLGAEKVSFPVGGFRLKSRNGELQAWGGEYPNGWLALKVTQEGNLSGRELENLKEDLKGLIEKAANHDPLAAFAVIGKDAVNCCFCGRSLDTDISRSHGWGPVCAKKYNLPWHNGDAEKAKRKAVKDLAV